LVVSVALGLRVDFREVPAEALQVVSVPAVLVPVVLVPVVTVPAGQRGPREPDLPVLVVPMTMHLPKESVATAPVAKDHAVKDHAVKDHAVKDHAVKDHAAKDHAVKDHAVKDHEVKDHEVKGANGVKGGGADLADRVEAGWAAEGWNWIRWLASRMRASPSAVACWPSPHCGNAIWRM